MHQFHLNFTEGSNIIKYRSSSKRGGGGGGGNPQIFDELWPFFFLLRFWLNCQFVVSDRYLLKGGNNFFSNFTEG